MLHTGYSIQVPLTPLVAVLLKKLNEIWVFNIRHSYDYTNRGNTLVYQIIVQDGINVQAGKFPKINKLCRME